MEKYLKIAVSKGLEASVPAPYEALLVTPTLELSQLAALVLTKEEADFWAKEAKRYGLPVFETTPKKARELKADVLQAALAYEQKNVPRFLTDLINYADEHPVSFTTPGHHNGEFYRRHPAGQVFKKFFGEKMLYADVSDTIPELGDTLTHGGTPLEAEQIAAQAFNADKAYFCTNGTTSSNTICATAALTKGDLVLFDRNNHKSLYNSALVMTGAKPVYLKTDRDPLGLIGPLLESELDETKIRQKIAQIAPEKAKAKRPFRLAVLQLETYDGVFYDAKHLLEKLGPLCDYILFDCAWGGYEQFVPLMKDLSPLSLEYGPDDPGILVTQSIHKQQAGLAQTSQILKKDAHLKGQKRYIDHKHFNNAYLKYVTTSYSYPIYASLAVNAFMAASPLVTEWWEETLRLGIEFRKKLLRQSKLFKPLVPREVDGILWEDIPTEELATKLKYWRLLPTDLWHGFSHVGTKEAIISPLKLTITGPGVDISQGIYTQNGIPGPILGEYLIEKRIIPGKSDLYSTLFFLTPGEDEQSMQTLLAAFLEFEELYLSEAPLEKALPRLVAKYPKRYAGYTLKRLCDEMHAYYSEHQIYHLQQELFLKETLEDYPLTPYEADQCFMRNEGQLISLDELVGKIALEGALPYPPGVFIVAPGEKWQALDVAYFKILLGAIERFSGFDPEIQGIYLEETSKGLTANGYAL
ncbi:putative ornithine decarboxylase [Ligilactobacillus faecis]|uniref:Ornithine decarboxylase n=2 Tax=Ligilactobacillus faecis TaxID=762833 RepID=A0ABV4DQJ7_9LACO